MEDGAPKSLGLFHAAFGVERERVLEVHNFGEGESRDEGDGADHLVVDDVGLNLLGQFLDGTAGASRVPIAHLEGFGAEVVAEDIEPGGEACGGNDRNSLTIGFEGCALLGRHFAMRDGEEVNLVPFGEFQNLMVSTEFVAFFEGIGEPREND